MKINSIQIAAMGAMIIGIIATNSCEEDDNTTTPTLITSAPTNVDTITATLNAVVTNVGNPAYIERGFVYGTATDPTINDANSNREIVSITSTATYSKTLTGLTSGTTYYARAYAINSNGTSYGNEVQFTAKNYTYITETGGGLNFEMVPVAGGAFTMGEKYVTLNDFYIGKYEVTQKLWFDVTGENPPLDTYGAGPNNPRYDVRWMDIVGMPSYNDDNVGYIENDITYYTNGFCYKLSVKANGGTLGTKHYRLPTEAEWEYAARGGTQRADYKYSGGDIIGNVAWYCDNADKSQPVGTKAPNELGIYDMSGNVWECCERDSSRIQINPEGKPESLPYVFRGGSWYSYEIGCRINYNNFNSGVSFTLGLRVVLSD